jgi:hypothetical protein
VNQANAALSAGLGQTVRQKRVYSDGLNRIGSFGSLFDNPGRVHHNIPRCRIEDTIHIRIEAQVDSMKDLDAIFEETIRYRGLSYRGSYLMLRSEHANKRVTEHTGSSGDQYPAHNERLETP